MGESFVFKRKTSDEEFRDGADRARKIINSKAGHLPKNAFKVISPTLIRSEYIEVEHYEKDFVNYFFQIRFLKPYTISPDLIASRIIEVYDPHIGHRKDIGAQIIKPALSEFDQHNVYNKEKKIFELVKMPTVIKREGKNKFDLFTVKLFNVMKIPFARTFIKEHLLPGFALLDGWKERPEDKKVSPMWTRGSSC